MSITNYVRSFLFRPSMTLLDLIVLMLVINKLPIVIAVIAYLLWAYVVEPIIAYAVGARDVKP